MYGALSAALIAETDSDASKIVTFGPNGLLGTVAGAFGVTPEHAGLVAAEAEETPSSTLLVW